MRLLFLGDVVGRVGRQAVIAKLPELRERYRLDFVVVNGENSAGGFGITEAICTDLIDAGADVVTLGNHAFDQKEALVFIERYPQLVRPINYPKGTPGRGASLIKTPAGMEVLVINAMGRIFMAELDDPFRAVDAEIAKYALGRSAHCILVDVHGEATSEKQSMGHHCDGRVTAVLGTHSHIPTADCWVLPGGTAYQTDVGMCGDYDSVIGMKKEAAVLRFIRKMPGDRLTPAEGEGTLCAALFETDDKTGLAKSVRPIRVGGRLPPAS